MIIKNTGYLTFQIFMAVRSHFNKKAYDFFKYAGRVSLTKSYYLSRNDSHHFVKLADKYSLVEVRDYFIANLLVDSNMWVSEASTCEGEYNYLKWLKVKQSLTYVFENDIIRLIDSVDTPNDLLKVEQGRFPFLLTETMGGRISLETLLILDSMMGFFPMWNKCIEDDIIWPHYYMKCIKYTPFIKFDKIKYKQILIKHMRT